MFAFNSHTRSKCFQRWRFWGKKPRNGKRFEPTTFKHETLLNAILLCFPWFVSLLWCQPFLMILFCFLSWKTILNLYDIKYCTFLFPRWSVWYQHAFLLLLLLFFCLFCCQDKIKVLAEGISSLATGEEPLSKCNSRIEVSEGLILKQVRTATSTVVQRAKRVTVGYQQARVQYFVIVVVSNNWFCPMRKRGMCLL